MTLAELTRKLEELGYSFVTVVAEHADYWMLTAIDPAGRQIEIEAIDENWNEHEDDAISISLVMDRAAGTKHWDIMFIGRESYL